MGGEDNVWKKSINICQMAMSAMKIKQSRVTGKAGEMLFTFTTEVRENALITFEQKSRILKGTTEENSPRRII